VLAAYLDAQRALAADDDAAARAAAGKVSAALSGVDMTLLEGAAHEAWMADRGPLDAAAASFAEAGDIAARRDALRNLSERLWATLDRFGAAAGTVRLFHCPMADGGQGADWLQRDAGTANPYYGASMLRCGSQIDSLTAPVGEER
jgi:Cu(I)/Ag(I) efflux system membrane fusion protein